MCRSCFIDGTQLLLCRVLLPALAGVIVFAISHEAFPAAILVAGVFTFRSSQFIPNQARRQVAWATAANLIVYGSLVAILHLRGLEIVSLALVFLGSLLVLLSCQAVWRVLWLCQRLGRAEGQYQLVRNWITFHNWPGVFAAQRQVFPGLSLALSVAWALLRGTLYSIKLGGQVVAIAAVQKGIIPGVNWLALLAVVPDHRRSGYARQLLSELGPALLTVHVQNQAAIALYETSGFCTVDRWRGYYGSGQDALLMARACNEQRVLGSTQKGAKNV
jgi:GNAT superfamily N-acetyltransferase